VATFDDGMHTAEGPRNPSANFPQSFAGVRARARSTHSRGSRLFDDAAPAVFTLGLSNLRHRAKMAILSRFRSNNPLPRSAGDPFTNTPASGFGWRPPSSTDE